MSAVGIPRPSLNAAYASDAPRHRRSRKPAVASAAPYARDRGRRDRAAAAGGAGSANDGGAMSQVVPERPVRHGGRPERPRHAAQHPRPQLRHRVLHLQHALVLPAVRAENAP